MVRAAASAEQARRAVSRRLSQAPARLADVFASVVRSAPEDRLQQILRTPARRALLEVIFWQMPRHIERTSAKAVDATVRWRITADEGAVDVYELQFKNGRVRSRRGESSGEATLTITLSAAELVRLASGTSDPVQAYFKGRVRLAGDIMVAARLQRMFRIPGRDRSQPGAGGDPAGAGRSLSARR